MDFCAENFADMYDESESESDNSEDNLDPEPNIENQTQTKKRKQNASETETTQNTSIKKKKNKEKLKPPTAEEMLVLIETEYLYNNNLFRLQIEQLISEVQIKNKRIVFVNKFLEKLEAMMQEMPEVSNVSLSNISGSKSKLVKKVSKIDCIYKTDQDLSLFFLKPERIEKFGLYSLNCLPGPNLRLSLNVVMKKICFNVKDFLNNRYLVKKFYYMQYLAEFIKSKESSAEVQIEFYADNVLQPTINITFPEMEKVAVQLFVTPEMDYFKPNRFLPSQNNVKTTLFEAGIDIEKLKSNPTPFYNALLGFDVTLKKNYDFIKTALTDMDNVKEGIKLIYIWAKQRELDVALGGINENVILYFITYLIVKKRINNLMSSYQVLRVFWSFVNGIDMKTAKMSIGENVEEEVLSCFCEVFDTILLDQTGCYNVLSFLSEGGFKKLQEECSLALKLLDSSRSDAFFMLFISSLPFYLQYDVVLKVNSLPQIENIPEIDDEEKIKYIGYHSLLASKHVTRILKKGLNERVLNIVPKLQLKNGKSYELTIGINLNLEAAFDLVERGPEMSDMIEADKFRKFWGKLASDRRFQDATFRTAVVFDAKTFKGRRNIIITILKHLLETNLGVTYDVYYDEFEEFIINSRLLTSYRCGTNEDSCKRAITVSDELGKVIRNLKLSLGIIGVQGISDVFCYTEVFPPIASNFTPGKKLGEVKGNNILFADKKIKLCPRFVKPMECVLQLEHSSKWPNNIQAIRHLKTALFLEIQKLLQTQNIISHVTKTYMDIFFKGFVFRFKFLLSKEIALMKKDILENGLVSYKDNQLTFEMEKTLSILPKVTGALKGLHSQYPSFGPGTALIKRWIRSQLIDEFHFPDIVINLINASLYINTTAFLIPNTPQMSFIRFLKYFADAQWTLEPVIANFNDEIMKEDLLDIQTKLEQNRDAYPPLYIIMPYDKGSSVFTKTAPSKAILLRITELSKACLEMFANSINTKNGLDSSVLFTPTLKDYNLLIHIKPLMNPRRHEEISKVTENKLLIEAYKPKQEDKIPVVDFNPVQLYLEELRVNYGEFAEFFHDSFGGSVIGVLWKPKTTDEKDFKVQNVNGRKLEKDKLITNYDALIEDFYILGKDFVKSISIQ